jgi:predicted ATPase
MVSAPAGPGEVPGRFVGREREIGELRRLADDARMITLCGPGGSGKSRLLRALLPALADGHPDRTFLVNLGDLRQPGLVPGRVAGVLGVAEESSAVPVADTLTEALRGRRLVLALDGCEQQAEALAALCQRLLAAAPGLMIVAASRKRLGLPGEVVWPVPPLTLPAADDDATRAARSAAVRLFADRASAAAPGFALHAGNCAAVVAACRAAGGLPLAIELIAARARDLDAGQIAAGLGGADAIAGAAAAAGPVAAAGAGGAAGPPGAAVPEDPRLHAVLAWTHDLLTAAEQVLLRRLSVSSGWSLEMAERVCADEQLPAAHVHSLLNVLSGWALAEPQSGAAGQGRWRLPGAVRDFAALCLATAGENAAMELRLREYAAQRAEYLMSIAKAKVPVTWPVIRQLFRSYDADARNVRTALAGCLEHGDVADGLQICTDFGICWMGRGALDEGAGWLDAFLAAPGPPVPPQVRGPALCIRAQLSFYAGDPGRAEPLAAAGLEECQAAGDMHYVGIALNVLAQSVLGTGHPQEGEARAVTALEHAQATGDWWNQAYAYNTRALALAALGRLTEARDSATAGLAMTLETDQHWGAALARMVLGDLSAELGDLEAARDHFRAALPFARQAMTRLETAQILASLGDIALRQGDAEQARGCLAESLQISVQAGTRAGIARSLLGFAELAVRAGSPGRAVRLAAAATALSAAAHLPPPSPALVKTYLEAAAGLGEDEVTRLWEAGLRLSGEAVARLAMEPMPA